jgi:hypothetical protein
VADTTICYYAWKKVSTKTYSTHAEPKINHFIAYDSLGAIIFEGFSGYKHGSNGLTVRYHPTGGVASIQVTMQPDGGIQYTDITHFYAPNGKFIRSEDHSLRETLTPIFIEPTTPTVPVPKQNQPIACNPVPQQTQYFALKNVNSFTIKLTYSCTTKPQQLMQVRLKPGCEIILDSCATINLLKPTIAQYSVLEMRNKHTKQLPFQIVTATIEACNKTIWMILSKQ